MPKGDPAGYLPNVKAARKMAKAKASAPPKAGMTAKRNKAPSGFASAAAMANKSKKY